MAKKNKRTKFTSLTKQQQYQRLYYRINKIKKANPSWYHGAPTKDIINKIKDLPADQLQKRYNYYEQIRANNWSITAVKNQRLKTNLNKALLNSGVLDHKGGSSLLYQLRFMSSDEVASYLEYVKEKHPSLSSMLTNFSEWYPLEDDDYNQLLTWMLEALREYKQLHKLNKR